MTKVQNKNILVRLTPAWAFTQSGRRAMVIGFYASFAILFLAIILLRSSLNNPNVGTSVLMATLLCLPLLLMLWMFASTNDFTNKTENMLDERERAVRHNTYFMAYKIFFAMIAIPYIFTNGILPLLGVQIPNIPVSGIMGLLFMFGILLPYQVAAWTHPDLPTD